MVDGRIQREDGNLLENLLQIQRTGFPRFLRHFNGDLKFLLLICCHQLIVNILQVHQVACRAGVQNQGLTGADHLHCVRGISFHPIPGGHINTAQGIKEALQLCHDGISVQRKLQRNVLFFAIQRRIHGLIQVPVDVGFFRCQSKRPIFGG